MRLALQCLCFGLKMLANYATIFIMEKSLNYCDNLPTELDRDYHDHEWGVPLYDDRKQFEFLMLEVMQCGLSWGLVLKRRSVFRSAFEEFDFEKIAGYGEDDIERIFAFPGMIRSRRKIVAVIENAKVFIQIGQRFGSFSKYLWDFVGGKTICYHGHEKGVVVVTNNLAKRIAADLRERGMKFIGPTTIYSHLQACGIINDHNRDCQAYQHIVKNYPVQFLPPDGDVV